MYAGGEGRMLIKAGSLFTVVDDRGPEMDQGSMRVWEVKPRGAAGRLMTPVFTSMLGRRLERAFANIKKVLEGGFTG
jgi:hypothetical protein